MLLAVAKVVKVVVSPKAEPHGLNEVAVYTNQSGQRL